MTAPYLASLNLEQRCAVEHGGENASPLLIIAGAGTGKTNTLAHRVAHLIAQGADPRRMMLLTFSRRAAAEMSRRVERIATQVFPDQARVMVDALFALLAADPLWVAVRTHKGGIGHGRRTACDDASLGPFMAG